MKKLFTLLMLLVAIVTGAKAADYVDTYGALGTVTGNYIADGISKITLGENATANSGIEATSNGATLKFTVSTPDGFTIKTVRFKDSNVDESNITCNDATGTLATSSHYTTLTASADKTSIEFTVPSSASGKKAKLTEFVVTVSSSANDDYELITPQSISSNVITYTSSLGDNKLVTAMGGVGGPSCSAANLNFGNGKGFTLTTSRPIKAVYCVWYQRSPISNIGWQGYSDAGATTVTGSYDVTTNKWTASNAETTFVAFKSSEGSTHKIAQIHIFYYPAGPTITTQPQSADYASGDPISALTVVATTSGGTLAYQWYSCDDADKTNAKEIGSATSASYTPTAAGFYYVNVKDDNGNIDSDVAQITISAAEAPTINVSGAPAPAEVVKVGTEVTLTATATGVPTPTIKWYKKNTLGEVETGATFTVPTDEAGEFTYYAVATNSEGSATSEDQVITVKEQVAKPTITPNGAYFEESQSVVIESATEDAVIEYSTDGGNTWTAYTEALNITETTTIIAKATKQDYLNSETATATFTKFHKSSLIPVSAEKTWTLPTNLTLELKNDGTTFPAKYDDYYTYGDIASVNGQDLGTFDGTTISFSGQYPYRGSNGAQNGNMQFIAAVSGTVTIEFSNTGGSNKERWIKVNETVGTVEADGTTKRTEDFTVGAGLVTITHVDKDGNLSNGLRVYKVEFTPATTENVTIPAEGVATYVTKQALDFSTQNGAFKAYVVTGLNAAKTSAQTAEVTQVPADTPLLLKGAAGSYDVDIIESAQSVTNMLLASDGNVTGADDVFAYSKSKGKFVKVASTVTIPAGKAYLQIANAPGSLDIDFDGEATGVNGVAEAKAEVAPVKVIKNGKLYIGNYNVAGQLVK